MLFSNFLSQISVIDTVLLKNFQSWFVFLFWWLQIPYILKCSLRKMYLIFVQKNKLNIIIYKFHRPKQRIGNLSKFGILKMHEGKLWLPFIT
jgi:hypothetical protein